MLCLDALLRLGRTSEGVAELLQEVPVPSDVEPAAGTTGVTLVIIAVSCSLLCSIVEALDRAMHTKKTCFRQLAFAGK